MRSAPTPRGALEPPGIAPGQDQRRPPPPGAPRGLESDAGAPADHDDGLPGQLWPALVRPPAVAVVMAPPTDRSSTPHASQRGPVLESLTAIPSRTARSGGDLAAERFQRVDVDLGEGGEGLDDVAQHLQRHAGADGQRGLLQPLAGLGAERVGAGQPLAVGQQGQEAVRLGVGVGVGGRLGHLGHQAVALNGRRWRRRRRPADRCRRRPGWPRSGPRGARRECSRRRPRPGTCRRGSAAARR